MEPSLIQKNGREGILKTLLRDVRLSELFLGHLGGLVIGDFLILYFLHPF